MHLIHALNEFFVDYEALKRACENLAEENDRRIARIAALEAENASLKTHVKELQAMDRLMADADLPGVIRELRGERARIRRELLSWVTANTWVGRPDEFPQGVLDKGRFLIAMDSICPGE